jgi:phenylpropionate dioxygenase-like ring-hydroxylating dioxygenase large terminal subunit
MMPAEFVVRDHAGKTPMLAAANELASLVRDDQVHHSVYTDPAIFDLEMQRLFGRAWLLLGHESQIPNEGDYLATRMGREPVIATRHGDGAIHVLINRCTHRGSIICHQATGNAKQFVCPYHGWAFDTNGDLRSVPVAQGYGAGAPAMFSGRGLVRVPRIRTYRGFIFASLASDGPTLEEFLGEAISSLDDLVDRAPGGEVEIAGGVFKHAYNGNWKLVLENHLDGVHPNYVHASSVHAAREAAGAPLATQQGERYAEIAIRQMRQNGAPEPVWEAIGMWTTPWGHGYMGDYHSDGRLVAGMDHPSHAEYRCMLEARVGAAEAARILGVTRWNTILYPNVSFMSQFRQLRIVHPLAVDRTVVYTYNLRLKGAPEQMFRDTVAFSNVVNGTASWVLTDDLEVYERVQRGLSAAEPEWVYLARGAGADVDESNGVQRGNTGTSEIFIRRQFAAWLRYMAQAQ